jgi:pilus assembly protein CpaD
MPIALISNLPGWTAQHRLSRLASRALALAVVAAPLAACGVDRVVTGSVTPEDYGQRHPIELRQEAHKLDLFASASGLDNRAAPQIAEFADEYRRRGGGQIRALIPVGAGNTYSNERALDDLRRMLVANGIRGSLTVGTYPIADPRLASPIQVSFVGIKAKVATRCGEWPSDLASGSTVKGWDNRPYWNHGCAYQNMIASQVADPRDLADKRGEGPKDTDMRTRAIGNVRRGTDPGTVWTTKNSSIGAVGN